MTWPAALLELLRQPGTNATQASAALAAAGLLSSDGLGELLDVAMTSMYDDPALGAHLARLALDVGTAADLPDVLPPATYLLAQHAVNAGELQDALRLLDAARDGFEAIGAQRSALRTNLGRTHVLNEMGEHAAALAASRAIIDGVAGEAADDPTAAELLAAAEQNSGLCYELMGDFDAALGAYERAEDGYRQAGSERSLAEVAFDRALALVNIGRHHEALDALEVAAETFRRGGFRLRLASALTQTAEVHLHRGELQRCLTILDEARDALAEIETPVGDHERELVAGRAYLALHLLPEALATFTDAVRFLEGTDLVIEQARARWGLGLALAGMGRWEEAAAAFDQALGRFRQSGHNGWVAGLRVDQARLLTAWGQPGPAREAADEAATLARDNGLPVTRVQALVTLGDLHDGNSGLAAAQTAFEEASMLGLAPLTGATHHALGRRLADLGRLADAEPHLRAAVAAIEHARGTLGDDALVSHYLDNKRSPFEDLLDLLIRCGPDPAAALDVAERAKSRTLGELVAGLAQAGPDARPHADSADEDGEGAEDQLLADLRATQSELFSPGVGDERRRSTLLARLSELEQRAGLARVRRSERTLRNASPPREAAEPTSAKEIDRGAGHDVPVVSYACANGTVHAFVVAPDGPVLVESLCAVPDVKALLDRLESQFARVAAGGARMQRHADQQTRSATATLQALHELVVAPLLPHLPPGAGPRPLVFVPDGPLHGVPFPAVHNGTSWMVDEFELSCAPSIETFRSTGEARSGPAIVLGTGDELAPLVEDEVRAVGERTGDATVFVGPDATWDNLRSRLAGAAHLHLAGHAVFRPDNPMYSALRLADRWVTAADMLSWDLRGRTVVLSACGTARSAVSTAEVFGFVRGLLGAGAVSVLASLWTVDDAATASLMSRFYELRRSASPVAALRLAQQAVAVEQPHPYYWAPWVLIGRR